MDLATILSKENASISALYSQGMFNVHTASNSLPESWIVNTYCWFKDTCMCSPSRIAKSRSWASCRLYISRLTCVGWAKLEVTFFHWLIAVYFIRQQIRSQLCSGLCQLHPFDKSSVLWRFQTSYCTVKRIPGKHVLIIPEPIHEELTIML
jgi:hypothetical protein